MVLEFTIAGPPISHQTRNRALLQQWRDQVLADALKVWPAEAPPLEGFLQITVVYYHDGDSVRTDNDNLIKPIQDALIGLVYADDRQITDTHIRKTDLNGKFVVRNMSPVLAEAFCRGEEFLYIKVQKADNDGRLP